MLAKIQTFISIKTISVSSKAGDALKILTIQ